METILSHCPNQYLINVQTQVCNRSVTGRHDDGTQWFCVFEISCITSRIFIALSSILQSQGMQDAIFDAIGWER